LADVALRDDLRRVDLRAFLRPPAFFRPLDFLRPPDFRPPLRVALRRVVRFAVDLRAPPFFEADFLDLLRLAAIILCSHPFSGL